MVVTQIAAGNGPQREEVIVAWLLGIPRNWAVHFAKTCPPSPGERGCFLVWGDGTPPSVHSGEGTVERRS